MIIEVKLLFFLKLYEYVNIYIMYNPGFDLDIFYGKVKFCNLGLYMEKR